MVSGVEGILHVSGKNRLAQVIGKRVAVGQTGEAADQQVRQPVAGGAAVESELPVVLLIVDGVELVLTQIEAKADLVPATDPRDVVRHLVGVDIEKAGGAGAATHVEAAA